MSYKILAKYIKDLKFEIPNTETYFEFTKEIAKYKINIDIKSKEIKKKIIEVETCLHLKPHEKDTGKLKSNIVVKLHSAEDSFIPLGMAATSTLPDSQSIYNNAIKLYKDD